MNNKIRSRWFLATCVSILPLLCLGSGCAASKSKEKPLQSRGWIGGHVMAVGDFPKALIPRPKSAVLLTQLATNTPAAAAGLHEGDLILALDHHPVEKLRPFRHRIDHLKPGASLPVTVYRDGKIADYTVVVGRETYHDGGAFTLYFPSIAYGWDLWPRGDHPGVSLVALGYRVDDVSRVELGTVDQQYHLKCDPTNHPYDENYKFWLGFMEFSKGKNVIGQEMADAAK